MHVAETSRALLAQSCRIRDIDCGDSGACDKDQECKFACARFASIQDKLLPPEPAEEEEADEEQARTDPPTVADAGPLG